VQPSAAKGLGQRVHDVGAGLRTFVAKVVAFGELILPFATPDSPNEFGSGRDQKSKNLKI
jgi:hypothetical protein